MQDFSEALEFIKSSIAKMDRLISAILNLTREGRREFEPVRIDTRELIEAIVTTVAHQAAEAKAQIHIEPLPEITSDRLALEQIFSNLIDNALKYLKPGVPGDISVRGRTKLGFAIFEITDNGRGIDPKDHQRIFDLFRRAGTQDRPGQGIGLAHVRALVRRLGGTMSVSSELDNGSTFTITLPINWTGNSRNKDIHEYASYHHHDRGRRGTRPSDRAKYPSLRRQQRDHAVHQRYSRGAIICSAATAPASITRARHCLSCSI